MNATMMRKGLPFPQFPGVGIIRTGMQTMQETDQIPVNPSDRESHIYRNETQFVGVLQMGFGLLIVFLGAVSGIGLLLWGFKTSLEADRIALEAFQRKRKLGSDVLPGLVGTLTASIGVLAVVLWLVFGAVQLGIIEFPST